MCCKLEYLDPLHTKHEPFPVLLNFCVAPYLSGEPEKKPETNRTYTFTEVLGCACLVLYQESNPLPYHSLDPR